jgi:hypothetical protein
VSPDGFCCLPEAVLRELIRVGAHFRIGNAGPHELVEEKILASRSNLLLRSSTSAFGTPEARIGTSHIR